MSSAVCTVLGKTRMAALALSDVRNTVLSQRAVQCTAVYSSVEHAAECKCSCAHSIAHIARLASVLSIASHTPLLLFPAAGFLF